MSWYLRIYLFYWAPALRLEVTYLPGAYEEETEALRFLDEFGTLPRLCELLLHDRTGGRRGLGTRG